MAPSNQETEPLMLNNKENLEKLIAPQAGPRKYELAYSNVIAFSYWHLGGLYGLYLCSTSAKWATIVFNMAPSNQETEPLMLNNKENLEKLIAPQAGPRKYELAYSNVIAFSYWHLGGLYGLYLCSTSAKWATIVFSFFLFLLAEIGITAGAHRLWSHKSFKAKLPLEILLMVFNSIAFQHTATDWVRNHRLHHKYSDTDADPYNAARGFFFSHVGWLLVRKHEEVMKRGKYTEMSDIYSNPVLRFQRKYAVPLIGALSFLLPTVIPMYFWGEKLNTAWHINIFRYAMNLNATFLINSAAHIFGNKPYDKNILPAQNRFVSLMALGEGFHNYHHVFPWDYRAAELGNNSLNMTTKFIDFFAWLGWAYDLKTVSDDVIRQRSNRTGDGTYVCGHGDKDNMTENMQDQAEILCSKSE